MSVEKLERVMMRLRARNPGVDKISVIELRRCIDLEIGTDFRTYQVNKSALRRLQWIKKQGNRWVVLTGKDLVGDY